MTLSDYLNEKFNGAYFIMIGSAVSFIFVLTAIGLYLSVDPSFSLFTHWISDLGIGPKNAAIVHSVGLYYSSIFMICACLFLSFYLIKMGTQKIYVQIALIPSIISAIGIFFLAVFPLEQEFGPHNIAAGTYFGAGLFCCMAYGVSECINKNISKLYSISSFIAAGFFFFYLICAIPLIPKPIFIFSEWLVLFGIIIWVGVHGFLILKYP